MNTANPMTTTARHTYEVEFKHSDEWDAKYPHTSWKFAIGFDCQVYKEGSGRPCIEIDLLSYRLVEAMAWCGKYGAEIDLAANPGYREEIERWFTLQVEGAAGQPKDEGLSNSVLTACEDRYRLECE